MAFEEIEQVAFERLELLQRQAHGVAGDVLGNVGAALAGHALEHPLGAGNEPPRDLLGDLPAGLLVQRQIGGAGAAADGTVAVVVGDEIKRLGRRGGRLAVWGFAESGGDESFSSGRLQRDKLDRYYPNMGTHVNPLMGFQATESRGL